MISEEAAEATHKRVRQYLPAAPQPQGLADPHHVGPPGLPVGGERPAAQQAAWVCSAAEAATGTDTGSCAVVDPGAAGRVEAVRGRGGRRRG